MSYRRRAEIDGLRASVHGSIDYAELKKLGIKPGDVLDFSVCTNPFMPPKEIWARLDTGAFNSYPDSRVMELCHLLAARKGVAPENILAGSGTTELIRLIALTYFGKDDRVLLLSPTFGDYEAACLLMGAIPDKYWLSEADNFRLDLEKFTDYVKHNPPAVVFLCNPNNPTGRYLEQELMSAVISATKDALVIIDEAYVSFVRDAWSSEELLSRGNAIILRSMTKDYGLAGIRLGYLLADKEIVADIRRVCPPWNVSVVAQQAGLAVLGEEAALEESLHEVRQASEYLKAELGRLGMVVLPSDTHYFLVKVGDAAGLRGRLLRRGFLVRDCASFGRGEYIRLSPRALPECQRLIDAISEERRPVK